MKGLLVLAIALLLAGAAAGEKVLAGHTESVKSVSWSPDGKQVASGSYGKVGASSASPAPTPRQPGFEFVIASAILIGAGLLCGSRTWFLSK